MIDSDVVVVGGGVVGLSAALAMGQAGYTVALFDAAHLKTECSYPDARLYAINAASRALFLRLGVWQALEQYRYQSYRQMKIWDETTRAVLEFDCKEIASDRLGDMVEESILKVILLEKIKTVSQIQCFEEEGIESVEDEHSLVMVKTQKRQWTSHILVVADGARSKVRADLGVEINTRPYQHHAIVAAVSTEKPHQKTAYQLFKAQGPLAFLPLSCPHDSAIVWSTSEEEAKQLMAMDDESFEAQLAQAFEHQLGKVHLMTKRIQFPLMMRHAKQYVGKNWLLMGDAAHTIHPLAGLGLNLGLADLSDWLALQHRLSSSPWSAKVLGAYQRKRRTEVGQMIVLMDLLKQSFSNSWPWLAPIRAVGLGFINQCTPLKRLLIRYATGQGD